MGTYATDNGLNINLLLLRYVVKCNLVRVVVVARVGRLEVQLLAILVVAVALLAATVDMLGVVCSARQRNNRVAAYPHQVHGQH